MSKKNVTGVSLDDLMSNPANAEAIPAKRKAPARLAMWLGTVLVVAVAMSTLSIGPTLAAGAGIRTANDFWMSLPSDLKQDDAPLPQKTILLDVNGNQFAQFFSENRQDVALKTVSPYVIDALIATEDSRFYQNNGFDPTATIRSVIGNVGGGSVSGGSGITQQLVKNLLILNSDTTEEQNQAKERSIPVKIQELKYAIGLEKKYTKEQILEKYINTVYFGNGAYGISAAAKRYFNTTPDKLTLAQSATLIGVINNPTLYDPVKQPAGSKMRRDMVLNRLLVTKKIDKATYDATTKEPVTAALVPEQSGCGQSEYPYYCELVRQEILKDPAFGETQQQRDNFLYRGGVTLKTALEPAAMKAATDQAMSAYGVDNRVGTGIAVVVPGTGNIAGIGQNRTWGNGPGQTKLIYAQAERQTGSSFKPFTLATAIEQGIPQTTQMTSPSYYFPGPGFDFPPGGFSNYGYYNYPATDAYKATAFSYNVWYVKLMERTGVIPVADMAKRLGVESLPREGEQAIKPSSLSLTLGAYEVSPIEMANAYSAFGADGVICKAHTIESGVRTATGEKVAVTDPACHQGIAPNVAANVTNVLQDVLKEGTGAALKLSDGRPVAGKTGTTNDFADGWFIGYTPQYSTGIWTGDPRGGAAYPLTSYVQYGRLMNGPIVGDGSEASGPLWQGVMNDLMSGKPVQNFTPPTASVGAAITAQSVPDVRGMTLDNAVTVLLNNGYTPIISQDTAAPNAALPPNIVVNQLPPGGTNGSYGQPITLTLSSGSATNTIIPKKGTKP